MRHIDGMVKWSNPDKIVGCTKKIWDNLGEEGIEIVKEYIGIVLRMNNVEWCINKCGVLFLPSEWRRMIVDKKKEQGREREQRERSGFWLSQHQSCTILFFPSLVIYDFLQRPQSALISLQAQCVEPLNNTDLDLVHC